MPRRGAEPRRGVYSGSKPGEMNKKNKLLLFLGAAAILPAAGKTGTTTGGGTPGS